MVEYQQFHMFESDTVNSLKCFHFEADIKGSNKSCLPTEFCKYSLACLRHLGTDSEKQILILKAKVKSLSLV